MSGALYIEYLQLHYLFLGNFNNAIHFYNMEFNCQFACLSYHFLRQYLNSIYTFISFYTNSYYQSSNNWPFCTSHLSLTFFVPLRLIRIKNISPLLLMFKSLNILYCPLFISYSVRCNTCVYIYIYIIYPLLFLLFFYPFTSLVFLY